MTDKKQDTIKEMLELYREGDMSKEQFIKIVDAILEEDAVQLSPLTCPAFPLVTYQQPMDIEAQKFTITCERNTV